MKKKNTQTNALVTVRKPQAVATKVKRQAPVVSISKVGEFTISHREYVTDVNASTTFSPVSFIINPQDPQMFPWLNSIATRFEMYRFSKLRIVYRPSCPTSVTGFVIFGVDYDFYDSAPSKVAMMNWRFATKSAYYEQASIDVGAGLSQAIWKYNNSGSVVQGDSRIDHLGKLWLATDQAAAVALTGELFVEYTVHFKQPSLKIPPPVYGLFTPGGGGTWVADPTNNNINVTNPSSNVIRLNTPGEFLVSIDTNWTTSFGSLNISAAAAADSPATEYVFNQVKNVVDAVSGFRAWVLALTAGAVILTITNTGTGTLTGALRFSTYKRTITNT